MLKPDPLEWSAPQLCPLRRHAHAAQPFKGPPGWRHHPPKDDPLRDDNIAIEVRAALRQIQQVRAPGSLEGAFTAGSRLH